DMAFDRKESDGRVEILNVGPEGVTSSDVEREALCAVNLIRDGLLSGRHPADYAILFRTKLHMGLFEKKLRECGIPCRVLGKSKRDDALTMVKNTVYAAINPYRNYYLFFLCRLPFFYIEDSTVYYFIRRFGSFWEGIRSYNPEANPAKISENELQSLERLKDYLNIAACRQNELGLSEFIIWLLKKGGIISSVAMLYPGQEQGLEEFIVNLLNKVEQNGYDIRKFLDYLDDAEVSSDKNCSADAVRIMTVHSSKGLQSPVVILPCLFNEPNFNDWLVVSSAGQISIKIQTEGQRAKVNTALYTRIKEYEYCAELAESKRLFYVAMTRARDELFFIGNFNSCSGRARWMDWLSVVAGGDIKKAGPDDTAVLKERYKPCRYVVNVDHSETCSCFITQRAHRIRSTVSMIRNFVREKSRSDGETQYKNLGDTVHLILEKLNDRESVSLILDNLPSVYRQHAIKLIDEFCDSDIGQRIFKSTDVYFNEYPFIVNIDGMIVNGRIDRINIYDDKAWIIDYKTGIEPAAMESYKIQLAVYLRVAGLMFPDKIVSGSLVDVSECKEYLYTAGELETGLADLGNDLKGQ
ncbi:MAG: PD-(D/E)XK nuclease family protein, partial [Oligoflexia bacterium]|nr:PD-(D/E)XK nuclease family protein [Oligoflexia bacterium]